MSLEKVSLRRETEFFKTFSEGKWTSMQLAVIAICWLINMLDGFDVLAIAYTAPAISAGWQLSPESLGVILCAGLVGMALGGWLSGQIHDWSGDYRLAFLNGIAWNLVPIALMLVLLARVRPGRARPA